MQEELRIRLMWILILMVDSLGIKGRCASLDSVDFITLVKQQLSQIGSVLARDTGYQRSLCHNLLSELTSQIQGDTYYIDRTNGVGRQFKKIVILFEFAASPTICRLRIVYL